MAETNHLGSPINPIMNKPPLQLQYDVDDEESFVKSLRIGAEIEPPIGDKTILDTSKPEDRSYLDQLAVEVCLHGEKLEKYERIVTKRFNHDVYAHLQLFVQEVALCCQRQSFSNTSIVNLGHLGGIVGLSETTVNDIITYYKNSFKQI